MWHSHRGNSYTAKDVYIWQFYIAVRILSNTESKVCILLVFPTNLLPYTILPTRAMINWYRKCTLAVAKSIFLVYYSMSTFPAAVLQYEPSRINCMKTLQWARAKQFDSIQNALFVEVPHSPIYLCSSPAPSNITQSTNFLSLISGSMNGCWIVMLTSYIDYTGRLDWLYSHYKLLRLNGYLSPGQPNPAWPGLSD